MTSPDSLLALGTDQEADRPTGPDVAPADGLVPYHGAGNLVGMYFYWDSAPVSKKGFYHGRVAASLEGGYYLLEFSPSDKLPAGLHEIVHVALMAEQSWSFYRTEVQYLAALAGGTDGAT